MEVIFASLGLAFIAAAATNSSNSFPVNPFSLASILACVAAANCSLLGVISGLCPGASAPGRLFNERSADCGIIDVIGLLVGVGAAPAEGLGKASGFPSIGLKSTEDGFGSTLFSFG